MESNMTTHAQSAEDSDEASESSSVCLRVPLILRKILQHIPNAELITFSLVNKQWTYEARCVMRDRGSLIASLKIASPCRNLEAFLSDLRQMNIVPFSGIRLWVCTLEPLHDDECQEAWLYGPTAVLDSMQNLGFNRLSCKYFHVIINDQWGCLYQSGLALLFVQKILKEHGFALEEFVISPQFKLEGTFQKVLQDCSFPNLKIFTFKGIYDRLVDEDEHNYNVIQTVVSSAPNLQEIHTRSVIMLEHLLEGRSAVAVPYNSFHPLYDTYSDRFIHKLRLKNINMDDLNGCSVEKFNRIVPLVLKTSRAVLKSLTINPIVALPIMGYGILLENVTKLEIDIGWRRPFYSLLQPRVVRLLKAFDFNRIFPNLEKVSITGSQGDAMPRHVKEFVRQVKPLLTQPLPPGRAANIRDLSLFKDCLIEDNTGTVVTELFPRIERLFVTVSEELEISCRFIWEHWMDLNELEIKFESKHGQQRLANLDSVFCGIFPEEVAELRHKDDEYLKRVNIVSVMPSFLCLKNLRKFGFIFEDDWVSRVGRRNSSNFLFSRVTGWIAFARCPALSVTIEYNMLVLFERALSHMKPFASVVPIDPYAQRSTELD